MILGTTPIDAGGASELRDLGGGEADVGSKDLGSSAFGANSTPRNPGRWNRAGSAGKHKRKTWLQAGS